MRATLSTIIIIFFLALLVPAAHGLESVRIGVIDFQKALDECQAGKDAKLELEKMFRERERNLMERGNEIKGLQETIKKQASMLSPEAVKEKERELMLMNREFKRQYDDFVEEMRLREKDLRNPILMELERIVKEIGQKGGYTLIVHKDRTLILYSPQTIDLTDELINRYDEFYLKTKR
jgi:outer membrane protein